MTFQTDLYDSMLEDVYELTKRDDLEGETRIALRAATTNMHLTGFYWRDAVTTNVQLPNLSGQTGYNISTLFPMCRGFSRLRPLDVSGQLVSPSDVAEIQIVEMGDIYDPEYGNVRNNIAYVSGDQLVVRTPGNFGGLAVEWAKAPQTRRELYDSWIAQMFPSGILYWAAALVFNTNGNEEKARSYLTQVEKVYIPQLQQNAMLAAMR